VRLLGPTGLNRRRRGFPDPHLNLSSCPDFLVEKDNEYCVCEMPCNVTRYGKELSKVKIPRKASAKYLAKKYNKSEQYIG